MPRLVSFDLQPQGWLRIQGRRFTILEVPRGSPVIRIQEDNSNEVTTVTRSELALLVVKEQAEFVDDLEEPECKPTRTVTYLERLPLTRMLDWHAKIFMLRRMQPHAGQSPKSPSFCTAFDEANVELVRCYELMGLPLGKAWSKWTIYHDLVRWRTQHFELFAVQRKGIEYCRHDTAGRNAWRETKKAIQELALASPHLGPTALARQLKKTP